MFAGRTATQKHERKVADKRLAGLKKTLLHGHAMSASKFNNLKFKS
jgi:hypothetical protein